MKKTLLIVLLVSFIFGCKNQPEPKPEKEPLIMVKQSEMALLMNEMYAFNESIKNQITNGKLYNSFPEHFNKIYTAVLTDPSVKDAEFETNSKYFIQNQKAVFEDSNSDLKLRYNNAVNACISCHNVTCVGPIPRIKKLLLK